MNAADTLGRQLVQSLLYATALVIVLSVLSFVPYLGFFAYPLVPGIDLAGVVFSSGVESLHLLRFEVASIAFNIFIYAALLYLLFAEPRTRERRTFPGYYTGMPSAEPVTAASAMSTPAPAGPPGGDDVPFERPEAE